MAMASTTTTTATTTATKQDLLVSANFATTTSSSSSCYNHSLAHPKSSTIDYDHEIYLQLTAEAGRPAKTANQVYREERARQKSTRALDPAISDPQGEPGAIDFECAEKSHRG